MIGPAADAAVDDMEATLLLPRCLKLPNGGRGGGVFELAATDPPAVALGEK